MRGRILSSLMLVGSLFLASTPAQATMLEQFNIDDMVTRADKIFRGTVVDIEQGSIEIGGGELSVVTYRIKVDDLIKGTADIVKGDTSVMEIRMVGSIKESAERDDGLVHFSVFQDIPKFTMGSEYLLLTTPRSSAGLSTTVGLGQGAFDIIEKNKEDMAMNGNHNMGLGMDHDGPVSYTELKAAITAAMH